MGRKGKNSLVAKKFIVNINNKLIDINLTKDEKIENSLLLHIITPNQIQQNHKKQKRPRAPKNSKKKDEENSNINNNSNFDLISVDDDIFGNDTQIIEDIESENEFHMYFNHTFLDEYF